MILDPVKSSQYSLLSLLVTPSIVIPLLLVEWAVTILKLLFSPS